MIGVLLGLSAALGFGSSAVFARLAMQYMRSTTATLVSLIVGTAVSLAVAFILYSEEIVALAGIAFLWFLLSGTLTFLLGRLLNYTGVKMAGVSKATPIVGTAPLFATILAVTVGGESINTLILLGTLAVVGGLALILSQR